MELVKCRLQAQVGSASIAPRTSGPSQCVRDILRSSGVAGLWRGYFRLVLATLVHERQGLMTRSKWQLLDARSAREHGVVRGLRGRLMWINVRSNMFGE